MTFSKRPLRGWSKRLPTATLPLRGKHVRRSLAQEVEALRQQGSNVFGWDWVATSSFRIG